MDPDGIVRSLDAPIRCLEKIRALLTGHTAPLKRRMQRIRQEAQHDERRGASKDRSSAEEDGDQVKGNCGVKSRLAFFLTDAQAVWWRS